MRNVNRALLREVRRHDTQVLTRRQWGSKHQRLYQLRRVIKRHFVLPKRPVGTLWFHITVTPDTGLSRLSFKHDMQTVERVGYVRFKTGFPYNFGWDLRTGMIGVGMPLDAKGAHTVMNKTVVGYSYDQNGVALAIAGIGNVGDKPTDEAITELVKLVGSLILSRVLTYDFDFNPHSMAAYKDCPTDPLRDIMPNVLRRAKRMARLESKRRGIKLAYQYDRG